MEYIPIIIASIAVAVSFWQGFLAKQQLDYAKTTKGETEKLLAEIKEKVLKIESISDETRKDVKEQINKLVDNQDKHFETLLKNPNEDKKLDMVMQMFTPLLQNPDGLKALVQMKNLFEKK